MLESNQTILAIDASTELCSVALYANGQLTSRECATPKSHARVLLPMVDVLLKEAGLSLPEVTNVLVSRGPGSFTGIRICLSVAHGLAYAAELPITGFNSLEVMAKYAAMQRNIQNGLVVSTLDARMDEIYWSVEILENGRLTSMSEPQLHNPDEFNHALKKYLVNDALPLLGVGHGWQVEGVKAPARMTLETSILPHAAGIVGLYLQGDTGEHCVDVAEGVVEPLYLRNDVAWEKRKRIRQALPFA